MKENGEHTGFALCTGCSIGEALNGESLSGAARKLLPSLKCTNHPALCSEEGMEHLTEFVRKNRLSRLALAACSPRVHQDRFRFENVDLERINLREQVAWSMEPGHEDTRMCAEDQVRMGLAGLAGRTESNSYIPEIQSTEILVLGGGIAGMTAALEGADAGYAVHLVEMEQELGGHMRRIVSPDAFSGKRDRSPVQEMKDRVVQVQAHPGISIHTSSTIGSIAGEPGNFSVEIRNGNPERLSVGAIVLATGWTPYEARNLKHLGYGLKGVHTLEEFEDLLFQDDVPGSVLFVLCAGSRDREHLPYCSSYCCSAALKQVLHVRKRNPGSQVYVVYRDIRTPGFQEELYKQVQEDEGVFMTKGLVDVVENGNGRLRTGIKDTLLGEDVLIETDAVVLATGMVPRKTDALELQYRKGKGLPELAHGFSDSHFICFPYETRRTGICAAGTVRAPLDMVSCLEDATGAMMKAIQCVECVKRGESVHPRAGDTSYPELYMERCTDCKRCTEECPFGSYDQNEKGTPLPHPARCRRCGICLGSCPERVIGFSDFSINMVSSAIKAVEVPDEFEEKPRVLVFLCENDAYPALDAAGIARLKISPFVRVIPVRCLGSINKVWISDALSHGYDGILQIGCKPGDDYQCHFIHGSQLTEDRAENLKETLETMMLEPERIRTRFVEISEKERIAEIINEYVEEVEMLGPNPFKSL